MSIEKITTDFAGQIGVEPRVIRIKTTNTQAEILAPNFLQGAIAMGYSFQPTDAAFVSVTDNVTDLYRFSITPSAITLVPSVTQITDNHLTTWRGVWAEFQPGTIRYTITGNMASLFYPTVSTNGDSSVDVISMNTELPAFLRPPIDKNFIVRVRTDGSTGAAGNMFVGAGGQITFAADASNSAFAGTTNNIGFFSGTVSYNIA